MTTANNAATKKINNPPAAQEPPGDVVLIHHMQCYITGWPNKDPYPVSAKQYRRSTDLFTGCMLAP